MYSSGTAAAFTADSFVIDTDDYLFESIQASSFSLRSSSTYAVSAASTTSSDSVSSIPLNTTLPVLSNSPVGNLIGTYNSGIFEGSSYTQPQTLSFIPFYVQSNNSNIITRSSFTVPSKENVDWKTFIFPNYIDLTYDVSSLNSSSLEFSGSLNFTVQVSVPSYYMSSGYSLDIYIDGDHQRSYRTDDSVIDLGGWIYNSSSAVSEVTFRFTDVGVSAPVTTGTSVTVYVGVRSSSTAVINGLSDDGVLDGLNNNAQDAMNQQDAIESQWTGSMTENFNNLSLSDFTFPVAAVNGFSLISGIFNDLWNAMGDFRIVYVFPLTLGVVLLLIGRLSRTSVKRSSGRGDDGA